MYKDKEVNKNVKNIFLSMCDVSVFDIYFNEFGMALTSPVTCFSDEVDVSGNQNNCY
jgi:hypothetical protein